MTASIRRALFSLAITLLTFAATAGAQTRTSRGKIIAVNTLIGAGTAGISAAIHKRPVVTAIMKGSAGGLTVFAGKCLVAQRHAATDWIGHETVAMGGAMIANAARGRGLVSRIAFAIGPVRVYRDISRRRTDVRLDLAQTIVATYYSRGSGSHIEWDESVRHGALIVHDRRMPNQYEVAGVIRTWNPRPDFLVHERIHVMQDEFVTTAWEDPLEGWILERWPAGRTVHRWLDLGVMSPVWALANEAIARQSRPWESEAEAFSDHC